jgi:hypothetical protein
MEKIKTKPKNIRNIISRCFLLILFFIIIFSLNSNNISASPGQKILPASWGIGPFKETSTVYCNQTLSAGSIIPLSKYFGGARNAPEKLIVFFSQANFLSIFGEIITSEPAIRLILENQNNEKVYEWTPKIDIYDMVPPWLDWIWPFETYLFIFDDPFIQIPVFASGIWCMKIYIYDTVIGFLERNFHIVTFRFNIGETGFLNQLTAPFYFYYGGITFGWGAFGFVIPCFLLIILLPVWIILMLIIIKSWKATAKAAASQVRKIKPKKKKFMGEIKNEEKNNIIGYYE